MCRSVQRGPRVRADELSASSVEGSVPESVCRGSRRIGRCRLARRTSRWKRIPARRESRSWLAARSWCPPIRVSIRKFAWDRAMRASATRCASSRRRHAIPVRDAGSTSEIIRLYAALDERRRALGLSWQQFAHEIGHVSPSTLSGMPSRRVIEADGALQMLRWLGSQCGEPSDAAARRWPAAAAGEARPDPARRYSSLHAALEAQRRERGLTWVQVATAAGIPSPATLTRVVEGRAHHLPRRMHVLGWLNRSMSSAVRPFDA